MASRAVESEGVRVWFAALFLAATLSTSAGAAPSMSSLHVSRALMAQTRWVNNCEESGRWHIDGPSYFGGLGWLWATWQQFRLPWFPRNMADATPVEQAFALSRFARRYGMPDLDGTCHGY